MKENRELKPTYVAKADMVLSDITSGGKLVADQMKKFILVNIKKQAVMERIRVTTLTRESTEIPKMTTFGTRVLHPGTESQAMTLSQRVAPGFDKVTLTSKEIVAQVDYPRYVLKDQVEGPQFHNSLIAYLGLHTKRDMEDLVVNGYTSSTDLFLKMFQGMLRGASSNTYDAGDVALSTDVLDTTILTMPEEFAEQPNLTFFTNRIAQSAYHKELSTRMTPNVGDEAQVRGMVPAYKGIPIIKVPLFPNNEGTGSACTYVWYGDPKNFILGFHEDMELQSEYNIRERVWTVVVTMRTAQGYEHEPAVVKTYDVVGQ